MPAAPRMGTLRRRRGGTVCCWSLLFFSVLFCNFILTYMYGVVSPLIRLHVFHLFSHTPSLYTEPSPGGETKHQTAAGYLQHLAAEQQRSHYSEMHRPAAPAVPTSPFGGAATRLQRLGSISGFGAPPELGEPPRSAAPYSTVPPGVGGEEGPRNAYGQGSAFPSRSLPQRAKNRNTGLSDPYQRYQNLLRARNNPLAAHFIYHHGHKHGRPPLIQRIHSDTIHGQGGTERVEIALYISYMCCSVVEWSFVSVILFPSFTLSAVCRAASMFSYLFSPSPAPPAFFLPTIVPQREKTSVHDSHLKRLVLSKYPHDPDYYKHRMDSNRRIPQRLAEEEAEERKKEEEKKAQLDGHSGSEGSASSTNSTGGTSPSPQNGGTSTPPTSASSSSSSSSGGNDASSSSVTSGDPTPVHTNSAPAAPTPAPAPQQTRAPVQSSQPDLPLPPSPPDLPSMNSRRLIDDDDDFYYSHDKRVQGMTQPP